MSSSYTFQIYLRNAPCLTNTIDGSNTSVGVHGMQELGQFGHYFFIRVLRQNDISAWLATARIYGIQNKVFSLEAQQLCMEQFSKYLRWIFY